MQILKDYTNHNDRVHMCSTFDFLSPELPTAPRVADVLQKFETEAGDSWICWAFSNHDVVRHATCWRIPKKHHVQHLKMLASLLLSMRGSVCLYQGEELALPEADIPFERLVDPYGISEYAGFSTVEPWLPVSDVHKRLAVSQQAADPNSLLEHYRHALTFRAGSQTLIKGSLHDISVIGNVLSFMRTLGDETIYRGFNMGSECVRCEIDTDRKLILMQGHGFESVLGEGMLEIPPYSAAYVQLN